MFTFLLIILSLEFLVLGVLFWFWGKMARYQMKLKTSREELWRMLSLFSEITNSVLKNPEIPALYSQVTDGVVGVFPFLKTSILELNEEKQILIPISWQGLPKEYSQLKTSQDYGISRAGRSLDGRALVTRQPAYSNDALNDPQIGDSSKRVARLLNLNAGSAQPILGKKKTYGVFMTYSSLKNVYNIERIQFLQTLANFLAMWLENKQNERG